MGPGQSIFGEWQSVSMEGTVHGPPVTMIIAPYESGGLSFSVPARKHLTRLKFDGKLYPDSGAGNMKGSSSSGRRVSDSVLEIDGQLDGRLDLRTQLTLSNGGKTLTAVHKPAKSTAVFTEVWDKQ